MCVCVAVLELTVCGAQLMKTLYDERALKHSSKDGSWVLDTALVESMQDTDNVGLVLNNLTILPKPAQDVLKAAACFGQRFSATDISAATGESPKAVFGLFLTCVKVRFPEPPALRCRNV